MRIAEYLVLGLLVEGCIVLWTDLPHPFGSGCQGGLRLVLPGKAVVFGQRGESHMLSLEVPALEQPEIA